MLITALFAITAGALIVVSRNVLADLSRQIGLLQGTVINYLVGLLVSLVLLLLLGAGVTSFTGSSLWMYTGGLIGLMVVVISSYAAVRLPAFTLTLIVFFGQLLTGILIDTIQSGSLRIGQVLGAGFVVAGFLYNTKLEQS